MLLPVARSGALTTLNHRAGRLSADGALFMLTASFDEAALTMPKGHGDSLRVFFWGAVP
jgi:hypothetical protein